MYDALIDAALRFAARAHAHQRRKGTDVPYIVHPVGVMLTLLQYGETEAELLVAALLHDTLEDTTTTLADLRARFGERVAGIVEGCSEPDKSDTWEHRKQHTIAYLRTATHEVQLVSAADKLHNLRSLVADEAAHGDRLWLRFKRGRAETGWYYRAVVASLRETDLCEHPLIQNLHALAIEFFDDSTDGENHPTSTLA
ncbi:MAG: HD domain-containing protein [Anaerolineales bacterium]